MLANLYVEINIICIIILGIILFKIGLTSYVHQSQKILQSAIVFFILLFASDAVWTMVEGKVINPTVLVCYMINASYFIFSGFAAYAWFIYVGKITHLPIFNNKGALGAFSLPAVILLFLNVTTYTSGFLFYIDSSNIYHRGPVSIINTIIMYIYIFSASAIAFYAAIKDERLIYRPLFISVGSLPVFLVIALLLSNIDANLKFVPVGITLPLLLVYLKIQDSQNLADEVTLFYNRNWFYLNHIRLLDGYKVSNNAYKNLYLVLVSISDMDAISSELGHSKWDHLVSSICDAFTIEATKINEINMIQPVRYSSESFLIIANAETLDAVNTFSSNVLSNILSRKLNPAYDLNFNWDVSSSYKKYDLSIPNVKELIDQLDSENFNKFNKSLPY